jgi:hypothetical protein
VDVIVKLVGPRSMEEHLRFTREEKP